MNYRYNGVELPALPDWDKSLYPHAVIFESGALWVSTDEIEWKPDYLSFTGASRVYNVVDGEYVLNPNVSPT